MVREGVGRRGCPARVGWSVDGVAARLGDAWWGEWLLPPCEPQEGTGGICPELCEAGWGYSCGLGPGGRLGQAIHGLGNSNDRRRAMGEWGAAANPNFAIAPSIAPFSAPLLLLPTLSATLAQLPSPPPTSVHP